MKKQFGSLLVAAVFALTACAQKMDVSKVPEVVKETFAKQFPGAKASWMKEGNDLEAEFKHDGHEMSALFDAKGAMKESEIEIKINELPAEVAVYIKAKYPGKSIKEAAKITKANGEINFEAEVNGKDLLFDVNGKYLAEG